MGYRTTFTLTTMGKEIKIADFLKAIEGTGVMEVFSEGIENLEVALEDDSNRTAAIHIYSDEPSKWEEDYDMYTVSVSMPDTVFCIAGEGEEPTDLWKTYYKNGQKQDAPAKISYDPFSEDKLVKILD